MTDRPSSRPDDRQTDGQGDDIADPEADRAGDDGTRRHTPAAVTRPAGARGAVLAALVFLLAATRGAPWRLFAAGPYSSDFYDVQGRSLARLRLSVPADVATLEGFTIGDETHLYFGIVPAVARMPIVAWGDWADGRLGVLSMIVAVVVGATTVARLVRRAPGGASLPGWVPDAAALAFGVCTPVVWLASAPVVYHEAELWGAVLALVGCERVLAWWETQAGRDLAIAGVVAVLAVNTRASTGLAPVVAIGLLGAWSLARRSDRRGGWAIGWATAAVAVYAAVNAARFGSLFGVPFDRQVYTLLSERRREMLAATDGSFFSPRFVLTNLWQYLRPDAVRPDSLFPFVDWGPRATVIGDAPFDTVDRAGSVTTTMPVLVVAAVGVRRLAVEWWAVVVGAMIALVPTISIGFVAHRYLVDVVPLLVLLGVCGLPWVFDRRAGRVVLAVAAVLGAVAGLGLGLLQQRLYLEEDVAETIAFVDFRYDLHSVYRSDPPPDLRRYDVVPPSATDGEIAVIGDCDAVLLGVTDRWRILETRPGGTFSIRAEGQAAPGLVAFGDGWWVDLIETDEGLRAVYASGETQVDGAVVPTGGELTVTLVSGPGTDGIQVRDADGDMLVHGYLLPGGGPLRVGPTWVEVEGSAPFCDRLADRLG